MAAANDEDQEKFLEEATNVVRQQAFYMKRAMDNENLRDVLKHAANMLSELRTGLLSPKNYYELYMRVFDEMRYLEGYFLDVHRGGTPMVELYETVQHAGNVLPRLYLLITVGSVYIKTKEAPAKDILKDLVEMTKGVQHPMRGLFLRTYLSNMTKNMLPDVGSEYEGEGGTVDDALEFVLQNFGEMNKLWVRMQHQGKVRNRTRRELERQDLRLLVGTNLVRLSQLEGVDLGMYTTAVLPRVLEQVANCKDKIAQQYLMDCVIQVFPDEFHLATLQPFLATCTQLKDEVSLNTILTSLMNRIATYASEHGGADAIPADLRAFEVFNEYVAEVIKAKPNMEVNAILSLQVALLNFAVQCFGGRVEYIDHVLGISAEVLTRTVGEGAKVDSDCERLVVQLLSTPLESLSLRVLALQHFPSLMTFLHFHSRKAVSVRLLQAVIDTDTKLDSPELVDRLLTFAAPLMKDGDDSPPDSEQDSEFVSEQQLVSRIVSQMCAPETDTLFRIYSAARAHFSKGGMRRIKFTLVPLMFRYLALARKVALSAQQAAADAAAAAAAGGEGEEGEAKVAAPAVSPQRVAGAIRKIFQLVHEIVTTLAGIEEYQDLALRLYLQCAQGADACGSEAIAYEFMTRAFALYEDMADSRAQCKAIDQMIGTLQCCRSFGEDNYDTLITKTTQYSAKLLQKADQCRKVYMCAHLFWTGNTAGVDGAGPQPPFNADDKRALECLQRALKIADVCMESSMHVQLFVEILNRYILFFSQGAPKVEARYLSSLLLLITEHLANLESDEARATVQRFYGNTLQYIRNQQAAGSDSPYSGIDIPAQN